MEIDFGEEEKQDDQGYPVYVTALFICLSGLAFLFFTVYYIAFLPVPATMQPLRVRVLTTLQLGQALEGEEFVTVRVVEAEERVLIHEEPDEESRIIKEAEIGDFYKRFEVEEEWAQVEEIGFGTIEEAGWTKDEFLEQVGD